MIRRWVVLCSVIGTLACVAARGASLAASERLRGNGDRAVETVYYNGTIHTMDARTPLAHAIAVGGGAIIAVGTSEELIAAAGPGVRTVDLKGRSVLPGLVDAHCHFLGYAETRAWIDLRGASSLEAVLERVASRISSAEGGGWVLGRGWDQNDWPEARYPDKAALDSIAPDRPVYLVRICGHAAFVNSRALALAGITRETPDPPGGRILRDSRGEASGILLDEAKEMLARRIPPPSAGEKKRLLAEAARECLAVGLVGVHEMGISLETAALYEDVLSGGSVPLRIVAYYSGDDPRFEEMLERGPVRGLCGDHLSIVGCKFYADGSLGARSAALLDDYSDEPGNRGILVTDARQLAELVRRCNAAGFQAATHAIGDRAVREALDAYEGALPGGASADARPRVEHAQVIAPDDIPRFAALGVIPSMQFTHCTSDMPWVVERLGIERSSGAYAWRSLTAAGSRIPGGSDFPVESTNPFLGIYAAVSRSDLGGNPPGGWHPGERLTVREALDAFTLNAAYAAHEEAVAGSLAPGKRADFIVCADDLFTAEPSAIPRMRVLATIIGGRVVYRADGF